MELTANPSESVEQSFWSHTGWSGDRELRELTVTSPWGIETEDAEDAVLELANLNMAVHWCASFPVSFSASHWAKRQIRQAAVASYLA
jgi:hypothetical protein